MAALLVALAVVSYLPAVEAPLVSDDTLAIDPCDDLLMAVDKLLGPGSTALR